MKLKRLGWLVVSVVAIQSAARPAEESRPDLRATIDSLFSVRDVNEVAISPDGRRVAWVEGGSAIYFSELSTPGGSASRSSGTSPVKIASGHGPAWSPDSRRLAFLSDAAEPGQLQLYTAEIGGGAPRQLTHLKGFLADPKWSPDGKTIAFLFTENAPRAAGPLEPMTPDEGVVESRIYEQRLTVLDLASGAVRRPTPPDLYVYEYDWSPDSKQLVATAAPGNGDDNWYVAKLFTISAETGQMNIIYGPPLNSQIAVPRWSPDGKYIAFISGLMSDEGNMGGDIFVLPAGGGTPVRSYEERKRMNGETFSILTGEPRNISPGLTASASSLYWLPSSRELLFVCFVDGKSGIGRANLETGKSEVFWSGAETLWKTEGASLGLWLARDGRMSAVIRSSFDLPPEVWAGPIGDWKQISVANREAKRTWGKTESVHWDDGGLKIQGWLIYPRDYDPAKRYPMVVRVHGGPGWAALPSWPGTFLSVAPLSTAGYFVLLPNPRGSFGSGETFTRANVKDFGYGDFQDILAGVDKVVKDFPVDGQRVGITGWSYGGFMTMWAITQTHRFRAAVAGAGLSNWQSYYGENDLDQWMIPFFGASVYDDPAVYAKSSPINFIKNARTPTLVLVGDRDGECPAPQSYEFWHALKTLGVETQFVIYPNEGHDIHDAAHRRDILERMVAWFDKYLK
jgi:dipeptidyl aminopeptidase/acylaminoacyl peptidase